MLKRAGCQMRTLTTAGRLPLAVIAATFVIAGGVALAATFTLTPQGCISDVGDPAGCGTVQQGLDDVHGVAVTADGKSVYAVSNNDDAIVRFDRDAAGALTPQGCIADVGDAAGCGTATQGLDEAEDIAVSEDGKSVYVVSNTDDTITRFERDTTTGALTPQGCIVDIDSGPVCGAFLVQQGLDGADGIAVSEDGKSVYVVSDADDAIVTFTRDTSSGALSAPSCIADVGDAAGCGATAQGLDAASNVAVSADNKSVYVAARGDDAIVRFDRDTTTGALTPQGCIADDNDTAGCGGAQGLSEARGVALSADGSSVYVAGRSDSAIATFARDSATGALTPQGCVTDVGGRACGTTTTQGLFAAASVAVSADGESVYAAATKDNAIVSFARDLASGALTPQGCIGDVDDDAGCGAGERGTTGAIDLAVSADGKSVYVTGGADDAIARLDRAVPVVAPPPADPTAPSNEFSVGKLQGKTLELTVPGAGVIDVNDAKTSKQKVLLKHSSATASAAGKINVTLKLTKTAKKTLKSKHKVKVNAAITFTPTGGTAKTQNARLKVRAAPRT
jgi:6-phosphogluconolactonase (cycloisomerase 2 family)